MSRYPVRPPWCLLLAAGLLAAAAMPVAAQPLPSGPAWYVSASTGLTRMSDPAVRATLGTAAPATGSLRLGGGAISAAPWGARSAPACAWRPK